MNLLRLMEDMMLLAIYCAHLTYIFFHFQETRSEFANMITCLVGYFAQALTLLLLHVSFSILQLFTFQCYANDLYFQSSLLY